MPAVNGPMIELWVNKVDQVQSGLCSRNEKIERARKSGKGRERARESKEDREKAKERKRKRARKSEGKRDRNVFTSHSLMKIVK